MEFLIFPLVQDLYNKFFVIILFNSVFFKNIDRTFKNILIIHVCIDIQILTTYKYVEWNMYSQIKKLNECSIEYSIPAFRINY